MKSTQLELQIKKGAVPCRIDMHLKKNKTKGIAVDGIPIRKASQLFGTCKCGVFLTGRLKYH